MSSLAGTSRLPLGGVGAGGVRAVNPWVIAMAVMLATFMEVLDTSIANVALPHIAGSLSATVDEATWVLTSYLVANAVVLPITGWLSARVGRKRLLVTCIGIFTFASVLCGIAGSLPMLVLARVLQGAGGGALQPLAQAIMLESFPPRKRGAAMAAYGMGVVVAPIIGPTLGGWITDTYSWRWTFYINLPVGILAMLMVSTFVTDPEYIKNAAKKGVDYIGFGLLAIWLAALQVVLDKGQQEDWFGSAWITWFAIVSVAALVGFVVRELMAKDPIVNLRILGNRNFAIGTAMIFIVGIVLYGTTSLLPLFLQTLMGYPAMQAGFALSPRGVGSFLAMLVVGRMIGKLDARWLLVGGFSVLGIAMYKFGGITTDIAMSNVAWPNIVMGFSLGFIFVPLTTQTMGTLRNEQMGNATGIYNLMRNLGGGVGISAVQTMLQRGQQAHQALMVGHAGPMEPAFQEQLGRVAGALGPGGMGSVAAHQAALGVVYGQVQQQAGLWAYVDDFRLMALLCVACVPLVFLFKKVVHKGGPEVAAH